MNGNAFDNSLKLRGAYVNKINNKKFELSIIRYCVVY